MPYDIRKVGSEYHVFNQQTGEDHGKSPTRARAEKHMAAMYANEPRSMSSPGMKMGGVSNMTVDDSYAPVPITHAYMNGKKYPVMSPASGDKELAALHEEHKNPAPSSGKQKGEEKPPPTMMVPTGATGVTPPAPGFLGGGILANLKNLKGKKPSKKAASKGDGDMANGASAEKPVEGSPAEERGESKAKEAREVAAGIDKDNAVALPPRHPERGKPFKKGGVLQKISKTMKKGGLHESLGVPAGEKIPVGEVAAAAKRPGKVGQQARLAETFAKFRH